MSRQADDGDGAEETADSAASFRSLDLDRRYDTYVSPRRLVEEFYQPLLARADRYDRIAGYFSASALTAAADGIETFAESGGKMRLLVGVIDRDTRQQVLNGEVPTLSDRPVDDEARLRQWLLGYLLKEGRLEIKVAVPSRGDGIFHAKLGCLHDGQDNTLTFEGSLNETAGGWMRNYERFKIHRSWKSVEEEYVDQDTNDFETLWNGDADAVEVYDLSEATEDQIADWADESDPALPDDADECIERVHDAAERRDERIATAGVLRGARHLPGSVALGDATCTLEEVWPHQRVIADTLVNAYPRNFLLCDEVGLGKTIEAGLTISRLLKGGIATNGLILPRAGLERQWQSELWENFTLNSFVYDRQGETVTFEDALGRTFEYPYETEQGAVWSFLQDRDRPTTVIMSWHMARLSGHRHEVILPPEEREGDPETMDSTESAFGVWDFAIVDEVHSARPDTEFLNLLSAEYGSDTDGVVNCVQGLYLLTATPLQVDLAELHRLVSLLNVPDGWTDEEDFIAFFRWKQVFEQALADPEVRSIDDLADTAELAEDIGDIADALTHVVGPLCRAMATQMKNYESAREASQTELSDKDQDRFDQLFAADIGLFTRRTPSGHELSLRFIRAVVSFIDIATPIETQLFRNTRDTLDVYTEVGLLDEQVADRNVKSVSVDTTAAIQEAFDTLEDYVREAYQPGSFNNTNQRQAIGFVLTTYRKRLASGVYAFKQTLDSRRETVKAKRDAVDLETPDHSVDEEIEDAVAVDSLRASQYREVLQEELEYIDRVERAVQNIEGLDPKFEQLRSDIEELLHSHGRFIVFSQYTDTMEAIRDYLHENGFEGRVGTYSSTGGRRYDSKDGEWVDVGHGGIKTAFKSDDDPIDMLVCTEAASEGLNLQECGVLINFDCPWNPTRIEQRIGRIDRIGQEHDPIEIRNYIYEGTIEEDVYQTLDENKEMFESAVGDMQDILDTASSEIRQRVRGKEPDERVTDTTTSGSSPLRDELEGTGDEPTRTEVIEDARKPLAIDQPHPAIGKPGEEGKQQAPINTSGAASILLEDQFLSTLGIKRERRGDSVHQLTYTGNGAPPALLSKPVKIAETPAVARAEDLRLFGLGDPLFEWLQTEYVSRYPEAHKEYIEKAGRWTVHPDARSPAVRLDSSGELAKVNQVSQWAEQLREWKDDHEDGTDDSPLIG